MGVSYQRIVELAEEVNAIVPGVVDTRNIVPTGKILKAPEQRALKSKRRELEKERKKQRRELVAGSKSQQDYIDALSYQIELIKAVINAFRKARKKARDDEANERKAKRVNKTSVDSQLSIRQEKLDAERRDRELKELQAQRVALESAQNINEINSVVGGFKSHTESVLPASARQSLHKPEPSISEMTENVPNVTVTKSPLTKSNIDTLAASTTAARKNLNKIFSSGSPVAIKKTLESPEVQKSNNIKNADVVAVVNEMKAVTNDPKVQQAYKDIGLSDEEIAKVNAEVDKGVNVVANTVVNLKKQKTVEPQKAFSTKQFRGLGSPIGSPGVQIPTGFSIDNPNPLASLQSKIKENPLTDKISQNFSGVMEAFSNGANPIAPGNPFGSLGVEFGNIMASVVGLAQGLGGFSELGKELPSFVGGVDPSNGAVAPNIAQATGKTQIKQVVDKGNKTAVEEPTTPVKKLGDTRTTGIDQLGYNQLDNEFWGGYEPVNSKKELELEIKNSPRVIKHLLVNWNLSAENEFYTGRKLNEWHFRFYKSLQDKKETPDPEPIGRPGYARCNYIIKKDGGLERVIPIGTAPTTFFSKKLIQEDQTPFRKVHDNAILITFDAGLLGDQPAYRGVASVNLKQDWTNISSKSITAEQWKTFDMIVEVMYRHSPGGVFKGYDQFLAEQRIDFPEGSTQATQISRFMNLIGPEFDVGSYLLKKREIPDGEDGDDDPYADLTDDYLNSDEDVE